MAAIASGCADDGASVDEAGSESSSSSSSSTGPTTSTTTPTTESSSSADGSSSSEGGSSSDGSSSDGSGDSSGASGSSGSESTTSAVGECGDGVVEPAELCPIGVAVPDTEQGGRGIAVGDLDGDLDLDLVTTSQALFNDGMGVFTVDDPFLAQPESSHLGLGDVGDDGDLDVIVPRADDIDLRLGNGDGTFVAGMSLALIGESGYAGAIGDIGGDGLGDVVVGALDGSVTVLEAFDGGWGGGGESPPGAGEIRDVVIADLDGDAIGEVIASDYYGGLLVREAGMWTAYPTFAAMLQIDVADLDGDGDLDVVGALGTEGGLQVHFGDGAGGFEGSTLVDLGVTSRAVGSGDLDNDGVVDLVAVSYEGTPTLLVARGLGKGDFAAVESFDAPCGGYELVVAELDGDDALDLAIHCGGEGNPGDEGVGLVLSDP